MGGCVPWAGETTGVQSYTRSFAGSPTLECMVDPDPPTLVLSPMGRGSERTTSPCQRVRERARSLSLPGRGIG